MATISCHSNQSSYPIGTKTTLFVPPAYRCYTEDLTFMVILYEIYETSLRRVSYISYEMTTSVRFCLSYDRFKLDFIVYKVDIISIENATLSRTSLWRYMYAPKCYVTCGLTIFMTWRYPLNNSESHMINVKYGKNPLYGFREDVV